MTSRIDALLEAHVQHELEGLRGAALAKSIERQVAAWFQWLVDVKLDHVATPAQILGVIDRYVIELRVSGGITELMGELTQVVFASRASADTRVDQVLTPASYEEFADKVAALSAARLELIRLVTQSDAFGTVAARVLARVLVELLFQRRDSSAAAGPSLLHALRERLAPGLEQHVDEALSRYLEQHRERLSAASQRHLQQVLDTELLRWIADEIWQSVRAVRLSEAFTFITAHDLEDFVVLGYEFWLKYRRTPYFRDTCAEVVDAFFAKYGNESMSSLIEDMGVTEHMVAHELTVFVVPLLDHAARSGFLEQQIRAKLERFYRSPAAVAILG